MLKNIFGRLASAGDRMGVRNPENYVFTMTVAEALELSSEIDRLIRGEKELKSRIAELEEQQRWRPIETAPRDGAHFMAVRAVRNERGHSSFPLAICWNLWVGNFARGAGPNEIPVVYQPTHWMPLPEPPEEGE